MGERQNVISDIGTSRELETRYRFWLENFTPSMSPLRPVINWMEAEINDPSIDFTGHLAAFGLQSLKQLIAAYERGSGRTWPVMLGHIQERHAVSPLKYGIVIVSTGNEQHLVAAKVQLGV